MRWPQLKHQKVGTDKLVAEKEVFLFDEPGLGKTKQCIDAACELWERGEIDSVIVVSPANIRTVWAERNFGEIEKHSWEHIPITVTEYKSGKLQSWTRGGDEKSARLVYVVTNYEYIREQVRLTPLLDYAKTHHALLVLDESAAVQNYTTKQSKTCTSLRLACPRVTLLNGTPGDPEALFGQARVLNPSILGGNWYRFRSRYARMGGWKAKQIVGWRHLDEIQQRMAPYVLLRQTKDCLDLPDKFAPVAMGVTLSEKTWRIYKDMRDEMIADLSSGVSATATHAATKALRLSQITSGFLGGAMQRKPCRKCKSAPDRECLECGGQGYIEESIEVQEVGTEKLALALEWAKNLVSFDPFVKAIIWCRFRPETERMAERLRQELPGVEVGMLYGDQKRADRERAIRILDPRSAPQGPVIVVGTPGTGSKGLTLTAANHALYLSNDYSSLTRIQSEARIHRQGQTRPCHYTDVIAEGPDGQKTIDHLVLKTLRAKMDLTELTASAWVEGLKGE